MLPRGPTGRGGSSKAPAAPGRSQQRQAWRRRPGELNASEFLRGVLEATRAGLPSELQAVLQARQQGSLIQLYADEPAIHFELWLHRSRARVELGLHFETRDQQRNESLLSI